MDLWPIKSRNSDGTANSPTETTTKGEHNITNWNARFDTDKWQIKTFSNNKIIDIIRTKNENKKDSKIEIVTTTHCVDH